jgi:hypothetical protein
MNLMQQTMAVFFAGLAGGAIAYAMTRDPTSYANFLGAAVGVVLALLCVA